MTMETLERAIRMSGDESVSIGGGEPTLHPNFWAIMGICLGEYDFVWLATNGSQTKTALRLAHMARRGIIGCALSRDRFHDAIDKSVVDAFNDVKSRMYDNGTYGSDLREVRDVSNSVARVGRATKTKVWVKEWCACADTFVDPDGDIYSCGCKKLLLGNVHTGWNSCGQRFFSRHQDDNWDNIYDSDCLFTGDEQAYKKSFISWVRS